VDPQEHEQRQPATDCEQRSLWITNEQRDRIAAPTQVALSPYTASQYLSLAISQRQHSAPLLLRGAKVDAAFAVRAARLAWHVRYSLSRCSSKSSHVPSASRHAARQKAPLYTSPTIHSR
jgi:hypothetical protein